MILQYTIHSGSTDQILQKANIIGTDKESGLRDLIDNFCSLADGKTGSDIFAILLDTTRDVQEKINYYLNAILHNETFLAIESSWSGFYNLVKEADTGSDIKLKVLDINPDRLYNDLSRTMDFDQSRLFKLVYENEYGTFGGSPFSCLIFDYYFKRSQKDFDFVNRIAQVCAASHVPLITSVHPSIFDLKTMAEINVPRDLSKIFENEELYQWNSFRNREESKYVAFTMPRILGRLPYDPANNIAEEITFLKEDVNPETLSWNNAAYYMALNIIQAYREHGWLSSIRGVEGGGKVEGLPIFRFKSLTGEMSLQCPTEISITDRREKELSDLGFLPLCYCKNTDFAVFFGTQTAHKPKTYTKPEANANSKISCRLSYLLNVCRFAHYIKSIMRDKIGQYANRDHVETYLNNWIADYVLLNNTSDVDLLSKYPLKGAKVTVMDQTDNPGYYYAVILLQPHSQMEGIEISLRLVAELPAKNN